MQCVEECLREVEENITNVNIGFPAATWGGFLIYCMKHHFSITNLMGDYYQINIFATL